MVLVLVRLMGSSGEGVRRVCIPSSDVERRLGEALSMDALRLSSGNREETSSNEVSTDIGNGSRSDVIAGIRGRGNGAICLCSRVEPANVRRVGETEA